MNMEVLLFLVIAWLVRTGSGNGCIERQFDTDTSIVCVCNSTYCDSLAIHVPEKGSYSSYTSSKSGQRLEPLEGIFDRNDMIDAIKLNLRPSLKYQTIHGFGGAFTDSAGLNIHLLSNATQQQLMQAYFGQNGSRYSLGRVTIGGSDFSTRAYTLDDVPGDVNLNNFSLTMEDEVYKIPYMKQALELNPQLKFFAAPWTAPPWMKSNDRYSGALGVLKAEYYQPYANYLVRFLDTYRQRGLTIAAMSTGNEPVTALTNFVPINDMFWTPFSQSRFVVNNLGPTIRQSMSNDTQIWVMDDQRFSLPWWIDSMYKTESNVGEYFDGIAVHWYSEPFITPLVLDMTHKRHPDKFMIMTEACITPPFGIPNGAVPAVHLGDWSRGARYIHSIIEDINHWMTGWIDWNLVLDKNGGPNWVNNNVDAPIIVNPDNDEFFKQPMYYAIAHVSKFVPPNSTRIYITQNGQIESTAFETPDNDIVIVLHNPKHHGRSVSITDDEQGTINMELPGNSIRTVIYKRY